MNRIREIRFGPPKCFKTGAVVGTYPRPMLVFEFDDGGLDIFPNRGFVWPKDAFHLSIDLFKEDIKFIKPEELEAECAKEPSALAKVTAIDFSLMRMETPNDLYVPRAAAGGFETLIKCLSTLYKRCPFATIVMDPITGLSELIHCHFAARNPTKLADAQKWAPGIGYQVTKLIGTMSLLSAHTVFLFHETPIMEVDDETRQSSMVGVRVMLPSVQARTAVGGKCQQFLYQSRDMGKPFVQTQDFGSVKCGLGCRWPLGLPVKVGPLFKDIYERK